MNLDKENTSTRLLIRAAHSPYVAGITMACLLGVLSCSERNTDPTTHAPLPPPGERVHRTLAQVTPNSVVPPAFPEARFQVGSFWAYEATPMAQDNPHNYCERLKARG